MTVDLLAIALADIRGILGISGEPVFWRHNFWPRAIAQYNLGFSSHRQAMADCERAFPGLFIGGQARDGISVPDCLAAGLKLADRAGGPGPSFQHRPDRGLPPIGCSVRTWDQGRF